MLKVLLPVSFCFAFAACAADALVFKKPRMFAGKIEGNWEYGSFRECGTLKRCSLSFSTCGYSISDAANADWKRRLPNERNANYWVEFIGRKRVALLAEKADKLDSKECVIEVLSVIAACESSSPIYPDESNKLPTCASPAARR